MLLELVLAGMARDLHNGGVHLLRRVLFQCLRLLQLRLRLLPYSLRVRELLLRQLHLPPRHLPRLLRVRLLRHRYPQLLLRAPFLARRAAPSARGFVSDFRRSDGELELSRRVVVVELSRVGRDVIHAAAAGFGEQLKLEIRWL